MKRPILIISHECSGWHFLANAIAFNSDYSNEQIDFPLTTDKNRLESFLVQQTNNGNRIYKSHHDFCALEPVWPLIRQKFHILYLIRDGRDIMVSCFYYFNKYSDRDFFRSETVGNMMRTNPEGKGKGFHECYWCRPVKNMADRWAKHVLGYLLKQYPFFYANGIQTIRYEDLSNFFDQTMYLVLGFLNSDIDPSLPDLKKPTLQNIGDWRNHFTETDEVFFYNQAMDVMRLAGYR